MRKGLKRVIYWTPRVLSIFYAIFISLFALDVFGEGYGFWETIIALLIHLVPVYILVAVLLLSWRWPWVGAVVNFAFAILYIVTGNRMHWSVYMVISLPLAVISVFWFLNWIYRSELKEM